MADLPEPRVSDAERDVVVERLRVACGEGRLSLDEFSERVGDAYQARTSTELARLTEDLPAEVEAHGPAVRPTRYVVAVFSGARRTGPWRPDHPTTAVAVFGGCQLDLTAVDLAPETRIVAISVFGGVEVLVADGVLVDLGGFAVFGGREDRTTGHPPPGSPVVRVDCRAVFGGVTVRTRRFRGSR